MIEFANSVINPAHVVRMTWHKHRMKSEWYVTLFLVGGTSAVEVYESEDKCDYGYATIKTQLDNEWKAAR